MPPQWTHLIDNLFTSTWAKRRSGVVQQAFLKTPLIKYLRERNKVENQAGFRRIEIPVEYGTNEQVRWLERGGTMPLGDDELITMAYEDWKYVAVNITRYGQDDQQNRGRAALVRLVQTKINAAERALYETFESVFFATVAASGEPNGLGKLVATDPTSGTVHGLDRASYSWWRNQTKAATGTAEAYLVPDMKNLLNTCTKYSQSEGREFILITDQTTYELYDEEVVEQKTIQSSGGGTADPTFGDIVFKGRPLMWSPSAPSGKMFFVNTTYMRLVIDEDFFMNMTEWKPIPDQVNDRVAQILCTLNLVCTRPVVNGILYNISA
jgi:hypothetical protein